MTKDESIIWNERCLNVLERTYGYDAELMEKWTPDGEKQCQSYLQRIEVSKDKLAARTM